MLGVVCAGGPGLGTRELRVTCGELCFTLRQDGRRFVGSGWKTGRCEEDREESPGGLSPHSKYVILKNKIIKSDMVGVRSEPGWVEVQCYELIILFSITPWVLQIFSNTQGHGAGEGRMSLLGLASSSRFPGVSGQL